MLYASKLKGIRNVLGITQAQMAEKLELTKDSYRLKEIGKYDFKKSEIDKLIEITGKKYEDLF